MWVCGRCGEESGVGVKGMEACLCVLCVCVGLGLGLVCVQGYWCGCGCGGPRSAWRVGGRGDLKENIGVAKCF